MTDNGFKESQRLRYDPIGEFYLYGLKADQLSLARFVNNLRLPCTFGCRTPAHRVGHGLDSSMDWLRLGQKFCPFHCFSEDGSAFV